MEPKTENDGADSMGKKNHCQREKECGIEGENTLRADALNCAALQKF